MPIISLVSQHFDLFMYVCHTDILTISKLNISNHVDGRWTNPSGVKNDYLIFNELYIGDKVFS